MLDRARRAAERSRRPAAGRAAARRTPGWSTRLREAARLARCGAAHPRARCGYLERAQAEPPPADQRAALALELGRRRAVRPRTRVGVEHLREAYDGLTDPVARGEAAIRLGRILLFVVAPGEAIELAERAAAELPPDAQDLRDGLEAFELIGVLFGAVDPAELARLDANRRGPRGTGPGARALTGMTALELAVSGGPAEEASALASPPLGHRGRPSHARRGRLSRRSGFAHRPRRCAAGAARPGVAVRR